MFDIVEMHLDPFRMPIVNVLSQTVISCHRGQPGGRTVFFFLVTICAQPLFTRATPFFASPIPHSEMKERVENWDKYGVGLISKLEVNKRKDD